MVLLLAFCISIAILAIFASLTISLQGIVVLGVCIAIIVLVNLKMSWEEYRTIKEHLQATLVTMLVLGILAPTIIFLRTLSLRYAEEIDSHTEEQTYDYDPWAAWQAASEREIKEKMKKEANDRRDKALEDARMKRLIREGVKEGIKDYERSL